MDCHHYNCLEKKHSLKVGDIVATRGDCGLFKLIITKVDNDIYVKCKQLFFKLPIGKTRHFNSNFLQLLK